MANGKKTKENRKSKSGSVKRTTKVTKNGTVKKTIKAKEKFTSRAKSPSASIATNKKSTKLKIKDKKAPSEVESSRSRSIKKKTVGRDHSKKKVRVQKKLDKTKRVRDTGGKVTGYKGKESTTTKAKGAKTKTKTTYNGGMKGRTTHSYGTSLIGRRKK